MSVKWMAKEGMLRHYIALVDDETNVNLAQFTPTQYGHVRSVGYAYKAELPENMLTLRQIHEAATALWCKSRKRLGRAKSPERLAFCEQLSRLLNELMS